MGNCRSLISPASLAPEETSALSKETGFTSRQILRLHSRFLSLDKEGKGLLDRDDFCNIRELDENPLGGRIIDAFFSETTDPEKRLTFHEFLHVLAHFQPCAAALPGKKTNNSREEKLKFAFAMYDLNKNGYITRHEFKVILNMMVGSNITPDQLDSITDRTISDGDYEKNGRISFEEFCRAMESINIEELMSIRFLD